MKARAVLPRHVRACQHSADCSQRWFIWTWERSDPRKQTRIPYSCNSWRCDVCRRHEAAVTFARIKEATAPLDPSGWCFLVLTIDRAGYFSGNPWADVNDAYRSLGKMTTSLLKRIGATWGADSRLEGQKRVRTVRKLGNRWVAVVEAHRSGWPHVNLLVWCPELAAELRDEQAQRLEDPELADAVALARDAWRNREPLPSAVRERARKASTVGGELQQLVTACGWGLQSTAEAARSAESVAGYVVKLAGQHDASVGELAKITQAPLNAPERFRRLRSGKGFLPPRRCNENVTGCLVRRRRADAGDWEICAVNAPKDPAQAEPVERARRLELLLIDSEERQLSRNGGKLPPQPPVQHAIDGNLSREISPLDLADSKSALLHVALALIGAKQKRHSERTVARKATAA